MGKDQELRDEHGMQRTKILPCLPDKDPPNLRKAHAIEVRNET